MRIKYIIVPISALFLFGNVSAQSAKQTSIKHKINYILKKMTLEEKIEMLHGNALFSSAGVPRLGIPELTCDDGPLETVKILVQTSVVYKVITYEMK